jgi:hypothetical protein
MVEGVFFHGVHEGFDVFQRYAGIKSVDHHQTALGRGEFLHFFPDQSIDHFGRAVGRDILPVDIQFDTQFSGVTIPDPVDAVDQILQIENLHACGITDITVVSGYLSHVLSSAVRGKYPEIRILESVDYAVTNNMYSAYLAREAMTGEAIALFEGKNPPVVDYENNPDFQFEILNGMGEHISLKVMTAEPSNECLPEMIKWLREQEVIL